MCLAVERTGGQKGMCHRTQECASGPGAPKGKGWAVTPDNKDFDLFLFFTLLGLDSPLTYLWQLQYRRSVKINCAHISGLL